MRAHTIAGFVDSGRSYESTVSAIVVGGTLTIFVSQLPDTPVVETTIVNVAKIPLGDRLFVRLRQRIFNFSD